MEDTSPLFIALLVLLGGGFLAALLQSRRPRPTPAPSVPVPVPSGEQLKEIDHKAEVWVSEAKEAREGKMNTLLDEQADRASTAPTAEDVVRFLHQVSEEVQNVHPEAPAPVEPRQEDPAKVR